MSRTLLATLLIVATSATADAAVYEKHPVSPLAWEVNVERVGEVLFRYIRFSPEYPCLRLETFEPIHVKRIDRKEICKFQTNRGVIDVTKEPLSGVIHENLKLEKNIFHFSTEIIFAGPGHYYANCKVVISDNGKMTEPACTRGERPAEPDKK